MIKASEKENALISENALTAYGRWGSNRNSTYLAEPLIRKSAVKIPRQTGLTFEVASI